MALPPGTNYYFNNFNNSREQELLEDLTIESIKMYGQDMYYIPRVLVDKDEIYGEDTQSKYEQAIPIELYIKSVDGFEGDGVFLSKFGLEIRDQVTFTVATRTFYTEVTLQTEIVRPNEGDLIYFPLNQKLFEIRYVNYKPFFYQLGSLQTFDLVCELFEFNQQTFNTGIDEIDGIHENYSYNVMEYSLVAEDGSPVLTEDEDYFVTEEWDMDDIDPGNADNEHIDEEEEAEEVIDWTEIDPFSEGQY